MGLSPQAVKPVAAASAATRRAMLLGSTAVTVLSPPPGMPQLTKPAQAAAGSPILQGSQVALAQFRAIKPAIDRYIYLRDLYDNASTRDAYFQLMLTNTEEVLPFIYTPTVGDACEGYHRLPLRTHGLYITAADRGRILERLRAWPVQDIRVAVVTDGERILGLGDLGANGMGISEGKITLYTAAAGVDPQRCLPICLDVGTNNAALRADPLYKGLRQPRLAGPEYRSLLDEFIAALQAWQPHLLLQFEDFGNANAFALLDAYRHQLCCFNDDIQGTACICLAALLSCLRATGAPLADQRILFLGAGEAGTGIGELIALSLSRTTGVSLEAARRHCFFVDSKGLVCASRTNLQHNKQPFAHDMPYQPTLKAAIAAIRPTALIGVSTQANAFDQEVVQTMAAMNERPIILPLSNPTSKSECTYEQAYRWSDGRVLFASGSPFPPLTDASGVTHLPAQANNAYVFPALGHAAVLTRAREISDDLFLTAADSLAGMTSLDELRRGMLFPSFSSIQQVSCRITAQLVDQIVASGMGELPPAAARFSSTEAYVRSQMWRVPSAAVTSPMRYAKL